MKKILPAEIWTIVQTKEGYAVLLRPLNKNVAVPIFVGQLEVQSVLIGKEGISLPRPLTHDLLLTLLDSQGLTLNRVEIHDLKDNIFHAQLVITGGTYTAGKPLVLDSRPSDAFGLVTRCKCPIFISSEIVKSTGIPLDFFLDALENNDEITSDISPHDDERSRLFTQLNDAVEKEEYERAAEIRDLLKMMDEENG
ncbi:MAG: bifunctional nuclease family protein [Treponema sp.]|nr:bifunctional nuclease family protein [Treponema sp.]